MDAAARLEQFLGWVQATCGVGPDRLPDYRRIGAELLEVARGRRVTESHVLELTDRYERNPAAAQAAALITEVGDAFIAFEAAERAAGRPAPVITQLPERKPSASSSEVMRAPGPEFRHRLMTPPAVPLPHGDEPSPVTFASRAAPSGSPPHPDTDPAANARRRAAPGTLPPPGGRFRCPTCKVFVTPDAAGLCPTCGTPPPKLVPGVVEGRNPRPARARAWFWIAGVAASGIAALALTHRRGEGPARGPSVAGVHEIPTLGLRVQFPPGWRASSARQRLSVVTLVSPTGEEGATLRLRALPFYRGGSPKRPEVTLLLGVAEPPAAGPPVSQTALEAHVDRAFVPWNPNDLTLENARCEKADLITRTALRCTASESADPAHPGDARSTVTYLWTMPERLGLAAFTYPDRREPDLLELDRLIGSVELVTPAIHPAAPSEEEEAPVGAPSPATAAPTATP